MGNLHTGHIHLVGKLRAQLADIVVQLRFFGKPNCQLAKNEDLVSYPAGHSNLDKEKLAGRPQLRCYCSPQR